MGLRFRKSIKLIDGVNLNVGTKGLSLSFGTKGLRQTVHTSGRTTTSVGLPGTGLSYVKSSNVKKLGGLFGGLFGGNPFATDQNDSKSNTSSARSSEMKSSNKSSSVAQNSFNEEMKENKAQYEAYIEHINSIKSIHKNCDAPVDWSEYLNKDTTGNQELENLKILSQKVLSGDIDTYFDVIYGMAPLDDLLDFGSEFEFGTDSPEFIEVEFRVKTEEIIPKFELSLGANGKLSKKDLSKSAFNLIYQDYICSTAIRIARDMFAILPVKNVIVHAVNSVLNTATGHNEDVTILSVNFSKDKLNSLNFDAIDPSDAMANFDNKINFNKITGFKEVSRVV